MTLRPALCILLLCAGCEESSPAVDATGTAQATAPTPSTAPPAPPASASSIPERSHRPVEPPPGLRPASCTEILLPKGAQKVIVERDAGTFRLLSAGKPPHRELRYAWVWGDELEVGVRRSHGPTGSEPSFEGPPSIRGKATVHCISKKGDARIHVRVGTGIDSYAKELVGYQVVSARGSSIEAGMLGLGMKLRKRAPKSKGEYDAFSPVRLPKEPVGVGAEWETVHEMPNGVREKSVYEITSIEGSKVGITATIAQEAIGEKPGIKVLMSGTGELTVDLSSPIATSEIVMKHEKMGTMAVQVFRQPSSD